MSTAVLTVTAHAQRIRIHLQHIKARLLPRNTCPPDSHITPSCNINNSQNKIKYVPLKKPPANMANPWFGSDVAASKSLATLRAAVVQVAGHCPGCAAAVLMKHSITATAAAAVWCRHVAELGRVLARCVRGGCSCACAAARSPRIAVFLCPCERFFVMRGRAKRVDPMAGCGRVGICR